jgi:signal transduction histidine kinase
MDVETTQSIFQPFYSSKGSRGTGLGLSTTKKIVEEHGGRIQVTSSKGEGSTFSIILPMGKK